MDTLGTVAALSTPHAGPPREIHREPAYAVFAFETSDAADKFVAAARPLIPPGWSVAAGGLPALN